MWRGIPAAPTAPAGVYTGPPAAPSGGNTGQQKHDIFVGNLAFNTTEEQLHQAFSEIGRVLNVRLVTDLETGKPRGFAFVEFEDPQAALAAIRNMNDYELNGRRLRVNFSNSSHLEVLAGKLGMDFSAQTQQRAAAAAASSSAATASEGTSAVASALKGLGKGEMYDVVAKLKEIADRDADEARRLISGHPQLPEALLYLMSQLDMIKTPVPTAEAAMPMAMPPTATTTAAPVAAVPTPVDPRQRAADPRQRVADPRRAAAPAAPAVVADTPAAPPPPPARVDPRQRMDPRQQQQQQQQSQQAPPPPPPPPPAVPPPPPRVAPSHSQYPGAANIDPNLVQQVMSLTPQQIQQLPPDKQQSILALRQQITGRP